MYSRWIQLLTICLMPLTALGQSAGSLSKSGHISNHSKSFSIIPVATDPVITGELKKWHPITLTIDGPSVDELDVTNPFSDYRLVATFTHNGEDFTVPGYFAADGNAAETSASSGSIWRVHFTPQETGTWTYSVSFVSGSDIAIDELASIDQIFLDNVTGTFDVIDSDKSGVDIRGKGALTHVNQAYLQFANGDWFIKGGTDSPENILAYSEFDDTYSLDAINFVKDFDPHIQDWQAGDPSWKQGKGKGLIGAINYLSSESVNGAFILINNLGLNDSEDEGNEDVWPWTSPDVYDRYDVSKLAQWDIVFQHMQKKGMMLHFALQEIDNDVLLDNGDLGRQRKLFYREMVARFGYHNAVIWNIGEELRSDRNTDTQRKEYIDYIAGLDPYGHAIVAHTWPGEDEYTAIYGPLLGYPTFDGISFQIHLGSEATGDLKVYDITKDWYNQATNSGRKWAIMMDECCGWKTGVRPWSDEYNLDDVRVDVLWGNLMAGGAGVEWFFGDRKPIQYDLSTEDFRLYSRMWAYTRNALDFFHSYLPFTEMAPLTDLTDDEDHLVFAKPGEVYAVYLREGGSPDLDLAANVGNYRVKWYDPRHGGSLQEGSKSIITGAGIQNLGTAPQAPDEDWVVLVENVGYTSYGLASYTHAQADDNPRKVAYDASGSVSVGGSIVSYLWDFGDGNTGTGVTPNHTYSRAGTYHTTVSITDSQGKTDSFGSPIIVLPVFGEAANGLLGEYYNGTDLTGSPETRLDPRINFKWGNGIPIRLINEDNFTVRWEGYVLADYTQTYEFRLEIEDGGRLWIDDQLIIDTWATGGYSNTSVFVPLNAEQFHKIKLELIEETGRSDVRLFWSAPSVVEQIIPETHLFYASNTLLPIELTSFTALANDSNILLSWTTASETNNAGFEIQLHLPERTIHESPQRIPSPNNWHPLAFINGQGTTTAPTTYTHNITGLGPGTYELRLKQIDFDGTFSYSEPLTISTIATEVALFTNYPNPFNPSTLIKFELPTPDHVQLSVYDLTGRQVANLLNEELTAGRHELIFDAKNLASGTYFYRLKTSYATITKTMILSR